MMKSALIGSLALVMLAPQAALAQSDCTRDMKDMLHGTLDLAEQRAPIDISESGDGGSVHCTLADWRGHPSAADQGPMPHPNLMIPSI